MRCTVGMEFQIPTRPTFWLTTLDCLDGVCGLSIQSIKSVDWSLHCQCLVLGTVSEAKTWQNDLWTFAGGNTSCTVCCFKSTRFTILLPLLSVLIRGVQWVCAELSPSSEKNCCTGQSHGLVCGSLLLVSFNLYASHLWVSFDLSRSLLSVPLVCLFGKSLLWVSFVGLFCRSLLVSTRLFCESLLTHWADLRDSMLEVKDNNVTRSQNKNFMAFGRPGFLIRRCNTHRSLYHNTYCKTPQRTATHCIAPKHSISATNTATHCNTLWHTAAHCNTSKFLIRSCNTQTHMSPVSLQKSCRSVSSHCSKPITVPRISGNLKLYRIQVGRWIYK